MSERVRDFYKSFGSLLDALLDAAFIFGPFVAVGVVAGFFISRWLA